MLKKASVGPEVAALVRDLTALRYYAGPATNIFDTAVWHSVRAFQMQNIDAAGRPLVVDGIVGPVTAWSIRNRVNNQPIAATALPSLPMPSGGSATARGALQIALAERAAGHGEVGGDDMGPHVCKYLNGIVDPPAFWCAAFVSYCFKNSGRPMPFVYTLGARNLLKQLRDKGWGVKPTRASPPLPGDVIVWWRGAPDGWEGHVGLVHSYANGIVRTIEGNRSPNVDSFIYTLAAIDKLLGFARVP